MPDQTTDAEKTVREHVTTLHLIGEQLDQVENWMWQHLADTRDAADPSEAHRLALSEVLGLGTGAPWDAIRERAAELPAVSSVGQAPTPDQTAVCVECADRAAVEVDELRRIRYENLRRAERAEAEIERLTADRTAVLREAADWFERHGGALLRADQVAALLRQHAAAPAAVVSGRTADETQGETRRETVEYFVQCQQPDGTWESASSFSTDPTFAAERLAARRRMMPDLVLRLAERTTKVSVQALPDCLGCRHWRCKGDGPCGALLDAWQKCPCTGAPAVGGAQQPTEA